MDGIFLGLPENRSVAALVKINPMNDTALFLCSSGTTGPPKVVMLSHYGLLANLEIRRY